MSGRYDYYFGRFYADAERNEVNLSLNDLIRRGKLSGPEHFTAQLRRLIAQNPQAVVTDGSSNPPFEDFLACLDMSQIGLVYVGSRKDVNQNVKATLDCTLVFVEGTLNIRPHWTAYKEIRANEIINTLLRPLRKYKLVGKTLLVTDEERSMPWDPTAQVRALYDMTGDYYRESTHGPISKIVAMIEAED